MPQKTNGIYCLRNPIQKSFRSGAFAEFVAACQDVTLGVTRDARVEAACASAGVEASKKSVTGTAAGARVADVM